MEIRQTYNHLISTVGFPILVRWVIYIELGPWDHLNIKMLSYQYWNSHYINIKQSHDSLIFIIEIVIIIKTVFIFKRGPCGFLVVILSVACIFYYILVGSSCCILSNLLYKMNFSRQYNCWSLRCSYSIACRHCSKYIFIHDLTHGFNGLSKDNSRRDEKHFSFGIWCALY